MTLKNWRLVSIKDEVSHFLFNAIYESPIFECVKCSAPKEELYKHGRRSKLIKDFPFQGKPAVISLSVSRYRCRSCLKSFTQPVEELKEKMKITKRYAEYVAKQNAVKTASLISRESGSNINTVREIFTKYVEENEPKMVFPTPRILGIDGVYINRRERCILTDIENRRFFGLYEKVTKYSVARYLQDLPNKENVEVVTMDMSRALCDAVKKVLPKAKIVIDKYHIQRMSKDAIADFLKSIKCFRPQNKEKDYVRDRFLLYKRKFNHSVTSRKNLESWGRDVPQILEIYDLKEEFMNIWLYKNRKKAEKAFDKWKNKIPVYLAFAFKKILTAFKNWREEIFNYFDHPFTNAFTESTNRQIKMIQKESCGCSFWTVRAKMHVRTFLRSQERAKMHAPPEMPPTSKKSNNFRYVIPKPSQRIVVIKNFLFDFF